MIRQTSIECYKEINEEGIADNQKMKILKFIRKYPGLTRTEISSQTRIKINAVTGRINELIKVGSVYEGTKRKDSLTNRMAYPIYANKIIFYNG